MNRIEIWVYDTDGEVVEKFRTFTDFYTALQDYTESYVYELRDDNFAIELDPDNLYDMRRD